jgi:hypothetical protein|tara:strand:- start:1717 stop:1869 length:153 start_codon:yes stop_codon:yes gene_type:complete
MVQSKKTRKKKKQEEEVDEHLGCYSWPNCDVDPMGCSYQTSDPEPYGHRD